MCSIVQLKSDALIETKSRILLSSKLEYENKEVKEKKNTP